MTRESLPKFDLYGELEVSRLASVAEIEAAYRSLAKRHHPDVSGSADAARIKRLNTARAWLTDPDLRARYDSEWSPSPARRRGTGARAAAGAGEPTQSFGPNAEAVRHFLAELRGLDRYRARQIWDGYALAHARGHGRASRTVEATAKAHRHEEWRFAREAATVIAEGKLGESTLTSQVLDVIADAVGALVVRDLISRADFNTLQRPWTWRGAPVDVAAAAPAPARAARRTAPTPAAPGRKPPVATPAPPAPTYTTSPPTDLTTPPSPVSPQPPAAPPETLEDWATLGARKPRVIRARPNWDRPVAPLPPPPPKRREVGQGAAAAVALRLPRAWLPGVIAILAFLVVATVVATLLRPTPEIAVAGMTDAPPTTQTLPGGDGSAAPGDSASGSTADPVSSSAPGSTPESPGGGTNPGPTGQTGATGQPGSTTAPTTPGPGATPSPTPAPTGSAPSVTPTPTGPPTPPSMPPPPTPAPTPVPTPEPLCTVPDLVGLQFVDVAAAWGAAGFTGAVAYLPEYRPNYRVGTQSIAAGLQLPCATGITVVKVAV